MSMYTFVFHALDSLLNAGIPENNASSGVLAWQDAPRAAQAAGVLLEVTHIVVRKRGIR